MFPPSQHSSEPDPSRLQTVTRLYEEGTSLHIRVRLGGENGRSVVTTLDLVFSQGEPSSSRFPPAEGRHTPGKTSAAAAGLRRLTQSRESGTTAQGGSCSSVPGGGGHLAAGGCPRSRGRLRGPTASGRRQPRLIASSFVSTAVERRGGSFAASSRFSAGSSITALPTFPTHHVSAPPSSHSTTRAPRPSGKLPA